MISRQERFLISIFFCCCWSFSVVDSDYSGSTHSNNKKQQHDDGTSNSTSSGNSSSYGSSYGLNTIALSSTSTGTGTNTRTITSIRILPESATNEPDTIDNENENGSSTLTGTSMGNGIFSSLAYLESIRADPATNITRVGSIDRFNISEVIPGTSQVQEKEIGLCHIPLLGLFTLPPGFEAPSRIPFNRFHTNQEVLTVLLALKHLNEGDGAIIPELEGLNQRCNIRFTTETFDTSFSPNLAVNHGLELMGRDPSGTLSPPCLFLGAQSSSSSIALSILTSTQQIPVFSPLSGAVELDSKEQHPYFGRLTSGQGPANLVILKFLREVMGVTHLAMLHMNNDIGVSDARTVSEHIRENYPEMLEYFRVVDVEADRESTEYPKSLRNAIQFLKDTRYRYILVISNDPSGVLREAYEQGIAGTGEYNFLFKGLAGDIADGRTVYERDSPEHLMLRGLIQEVTVGAVKAEGNERFLRLMTEVENLQSDPETKEYIRRIFPTYPDAPDLEFGVDDADFYELDVDGSTAVPAWAYDTIISAGLAACALSNVGRTEVTIATSRDETGDDTVPSFLSFDGPTLYQKMLDTEFEGVTGYVSLDRKTGSRTVESALNGFRNIQEVPELSNETHVVLNEKITYVWANGNISSTGNPHIFSDGTMSRPPNLFDVEIDMNYIGSTLRIIGLCMSGIILSLSLSFMAWTYYNRETRIVQASQPIFLYFICLGVMVMGSSIIPMSMDDEVLSKDGKDKACMAVSWLNAYGFGMTFSALYAKLHRVSVLFKSKFRKNVVVTERDVIAPMLFVMIVNTILLVCWNVIDPLRWNRDIIDFNEYGQPIESYGSCWSVDEPGSRQLLLVVIPVVFGIGVMVAAAFQAHKVRYVHLEFAESEYISKSIATSVLVCFVSVPVMILAGQDTTTSFFALSSINFVLSCSMLLFIFVPKVIYFQKAKNDHRSTENAILNSLESRNSKIKASQKSTNSLSFRQVWSGKLGEMDYLQKTLERIDDQVWETVLKKKEESCLDFSLRMDISGPLSMSGRRSSESGSMLILDSPEIRETLRMEHELMKEALTHMHTQLMFIRNSSGGKSTEEEMAREVMSNFTDSQRDFRKKEKSESQLNINESRIRRTTLTGAIIDA